MSLLTVYSENEPGTIILQTEQPEQMSNQRRIVPVAEF